MSIVKFLKNLFTKEEVKESINSHQSTTSSKLKQKTNVVKTKLKEGMTLLEDAECPYCHSKFDKPLTRKKKCPDCGFDVYVRTLPYKNEKEKVRVAVTKEHVENIEIEWAKLNGTYKELMKEKNKTKLIRNQLKESWNKEPSDDDVTWHLILQRRIEHASLRQWGLYRNDTLNLAEQLYTQKKYELSLRHYFGVLYLDLNGCRNVGTINGVPLENDIEFDPSTSFVSPGIIKRIVILKDTRLKYNGDKIKLLFLDEANQIHAALKVPLSPSEAWSKLEKEELYWEN